MNKELLIQIGLLTIPYAFSCFWYKFKKPRNIWKNSLCLKGIYSLRQAREACLEGYRLPTVDEYRELCNENVFFFDHAARQGVFTFSDGFVLCLPVCDYAYDTLLGCRHTEQGVYWTSTPHGNGNYVMYFTQCLVQSTLVSPLSSRFSVVYVRK